MTTYPAPAPDPLLTHRVEGWRVDLLTKTDAVIGNLAGFDGGRLDLNVNATIRGGGHLEIDDLDEGIDWVNNRVQIWYELEGADPVPWGVFLLSSPVETFDDDGKSWTTEILDKLALLSRKLVAAGGYAIASGSVVTDEVRALIEAIGEASMDITDSEETTSGDLYWEPGTSYLTIANELLASINYFSIHTDGYGRFVAAPYQSPRYRTTQWSFNEDETGLHLPGFTREEDLISIPNEVTLKSIGDGDTEGYEVTVVNDDPDDPLSTVNRATVSYFEDYVEATSEEVLLAIAERKLESLSTSSATIDIDHAPLPLSLNGVASIDSHGLVKARVVIQRMRVRLGVGEDVRTTLREVA